MNQINKPIIDDAVSFLLFVRLKLQPIKITQFFGMGSGYGKVEKTKQFLTPKNMKGMRSRIYDAG